MRLFHLNSSPPRNPVSGVNIFQDPNLLMGHISMMTGGVQPSAMRKIRGAMVQRRSSRASWTNPR